MVMGQIGSSPPRLAQEPRPPRRRDRQRHRRPRSRRELLDFIFDQRLHNHTSVVIDVGVRPSEGCRNTVDLAFFPEGALLGKQHFGRFVLAAVASFCASRVDYVHASDPRMPLPATIRGRSCVVARSSHTEYNRSR
jgi:hypothetical protein